MVVRNKAAKITRSDATRRVVTYRSGHFTGYVASRKSSTVVQYESILERDFIYLLETDRDVLWFSEQPAPLKFSDGIAHHTWTLDFEIERSSGRYLVEVKPLSKVKKYRLDVIYGFARAAAKASGYQNLELWTDRELKALPRLPNAEILVGSDTTYHDPAYDLALLSTIAEIAKVSERTTVRELRSLSRLGPLSYRAVMRQIAIGGLIPADSTVFLGDDAILLIPGGGGF
ncbi:hypothetical protein RPD_0024 [Rhodopseudomonas palustris BisB5]|uniref:TnsA endonuclease N-terminal domain-containing protein n=1 Tax=Rhodopseudomonas palustris (strain BisB5) TaxID=316057 RepID=Q13F75_RHOPS|nr:hypothetical protein RPD_0024 [Rhodopseudomonas palustris BisB5]